MRTIHIFKPLLFKITLLFIVTAFTLNTEPVKAQQMIVDDAEIVNYRSFQVETWYGTEESWFQPAIALGRYWEFTPGIVFDSKDNFRADRWFTEIKFVPGDIDFDGYSYGFVFAPVFSVDGGFDEYYTYIPYSREILDRSSILHVNLGFQALKNGGDWDHALTTGVRGDFELNNRFTLLGEIFSADFGKPILHGGFRIAIVPGLLESEITYGQGFRNSMDYPGFNVGIAFTPGTLW